MPAFRNITGQRFGRLIALSTSHTAHGKWYWRFRCDCGNETIISGNSAIKGNTKSCGCLNNEKRGLKHGMEKSPEYEIWSSMKKRCYNPKSAHFHNYGGRGIKVCADWRISFENFIADVGLRPSSKLSIDRIDNNGHYEPGNIRWATASEQRRNQRK